ncbi:WhiB family transcriptional regulator [Nonomuraea sp. NPDC048882]|uniref:WhiB family transcriptional regulator n=1 Tax=Nonomuraea sp. NPDC048882 TaxID=3154347 RepID=UPI0033CBF6A6
MSTMLSLARQGLNTLAAAELSRQVQQQGVCRGAGDPDAWFPPEPNRSGGESKEVWQARRAAYEQTAQRLCSDCPARAACLLLALQEEAKLPRTWVHGIRGARAPWQRLAMLRSSKRRSRADQAAEGAA